MKATRTSALLTLVLLLVLATTAVSAEPGGRHRSRQHHPGHREIRAYHHANVLPVLRQQRQQLEPQLAPADRAQLAAYRVQLKALKEQGRALRQSLAPSAQPAGVRPVPTEAQRQQCQQLHSQSRALMLNVAQMAQKYEAPIQQLAQEVQPQKEQWAADIKAIALKNATPEQRERMAAHGGRMHHAGGMHRFFKPAMFLLMDPNTPTAPAERSLGSTSFYPNPVAATSQVEYTVKKAGPVSIDLLDSRGTKLRPLVAPTEQQKGPHTQQLDLRDLPAGTYFYKITTKSGSETKRFVKE